ncbi:MAG: hypothetical protein ACRD1R_10790 [Acidobacteriota bacterium]
MAFNWLTIAIKSKNDPYGKQSFNNQRNNLYHLKENLLVIKALTGTKDGVNKTFTLPSTPSGATAVLVIFGSTALHEGDATWGFTRSGIPATTITLGSSVPAPLAGEGLLALYGEVAT